jgi:putative alpha-1,2-mannosidase
MQFSKPFTKSEIFLDHQLVEETHKVDGKSIKSVLHLETDEGEPILVKTAISSVDVAGARKNLDAEVPDWGFDHVRFSARRSWQRELSRIRIETQDRKQKEIFYTSLYHMLIAPTLFDDVDGRYRGMDRKTHQLAPGERNYSTFSLWDTFRAVHRFTR